MPEYQAGDLTERIELQAKTRTPDGFGGASVQWTTYATVWALVRPLTGREREAQMRAEGRTDHLLVIRTRSDVAETHRALWRGRYLNLRVVKRAGPRPIFMEIEAEMGASS